MVVTNHLLTRMILQVGGGGINLMKCFSCHSFSFCFGDFARQRWLRSFLMLEKRFESKNLTSLTKLQHACYSITCFTRFLLQLPNLGNPFLLNTSPNSLFPTHPNQKKVVFNFQKKMSSENTIFCDVFALLFRKPFPNKPHGFLLRHFQIKSVGSPLWVGGKFFVRRVGREERAVEFFFFWSDRHEPGLCLFDVLGNLDWKIGFPAWGVRHGVRCTLGPTWAPGKWEILKKNALYHVGIYGW